jgi:hypothetical protein
VSLRRHVPALLVAGLAAAALAAPGGATNECRGIRDCIDVSGPWVIVPSKGEATYLLECPRRRGVVGGVDSLATSQDVHVTFDGLLGGPVSPGTTTTRYAFFRGLSAAHRRGAFRPLIGCIPVSSGGRATTSAALSPAGPPLDLAAATIPIRPGTVRTTTIACARGEQLVDSWDATAFRTVQPPILAFADAIRVTRTQRGAAVGVRIEVSEALSAAARPEVQVGVICANR